MSTSTEPAGPPGCPMTIAYIAIGAARAFQEAERHDAPGGGMGEADLVAELVACAPLLDRLYEEYADKLAVPFLYEVAEPFGEQLGAMLYAAGRDKPAVEEAETLARSLFADATT